MQNYYYFGIKSSEISELLFKCVELFGEITNVKTDDLHVNICTTFFEHKTKCLNEIQATKISKGILFYILGMYEYETERVINLYLPSISSLVETQRDFKIELVRVMAHEFKHYCQNVKGSRFNYTLEYDKRPHEIDANIFARSIMKDTEITDILLGVLKNVECTIDFNKCYYHISDYM